MDSKQIDIIEVSEYTDAIRSTGYKDIESAMSEIVDNSIEANANNIYIIFEEQCNTGGRNKVKNIYFLDDGTGMDLDTLQRCLVLGAGTKKDRKGMGRFGVGLPQSSMYATPSVEVYSWKNGYKNSYMSFLDVNKLASKEQTGFDIPAKKDLPTLITTKYMEQDVNRHNHLFRNHGTLVVWKDCDNVKPQTYSALKKRLEFELGRRFRYFILDDKHKITIINDTDYLNGNGCFELFPNDPCFLLDKNYIMGDPNNPGKWIKYEGVSVFEPFTENHPNGVWTIDIDYIDREDNQRKHYPVTLKSSVVKKEFYDQDAFSSNPGNSEIGKQIKKLQGISIVRANREIDFGGFDFFNPNDKYIDRWWSLEISFDPVLDEVFGVSNNKQHVELIKVDDDEIDYEDNETPKPIWLQLNNTIKEEIRAMKKRNKSLRAGSRSQTKSSDSETAINNAEDNTGLETETNSSKQKENSTPEEISTSAVDVARKKGINNEDIDESIIQIISNNRVNIVYESLGEFEPFFQYRSTHGVVQCVFNADHDLYKKFISLMINDSNKRGKNCFELLFGSLVRIFDETIDEDTQKTFQKLVKKWNTKVEEYLDNLEE